MLDSRPTDLVRVALISKVFDRKHIKILTQKQMLQTKIALAQVKAGNTGENLLNEIKKILYFLYRAKEMIEKVCNNIMNLVKL